MEDPIKIGKIVKRVVEKAIQENRDLATKPVDKGGYNTSEEDWQVYDSSLGDFADTFSSCLPGEDDLEELANDIKSKKIKIFELKSTVFRKYIEGTLSSRERHDLTAIEL